MTSSERIHAALQHREPDTLPVDVGACIVTGIHADKYTEYARHIGVSPGERERPVMFERAQAALFGDEMAAAFFVDVRGVYPTQLGPARWARKRWSDETNDYIIDEWNTTWRKDKKDGLYFDVIDSPLSHEEEITVSDVETFPWPDLANDETVAGMAQRARQIHEELRCAVFVENPMVTIFDAPGRIRGHETLFMDLLLRPDIAEAFMDTMLRLQLDYWRRVLSEIGDIPVIVRTSDDLGAQNALIMAPDTYRTMLKPRHEKLFAGIREAAVGDVSIFFHSDGAIRPLIPDLIEIGVDILNPVQDSCDGMDLTELKRDFGSDVTFWGAGIETQSMLKSGTPQEVEDDVCRRIEIMAPGGGFVFASVHNIQPDVPNKNIDAVRKALERYR